jgi:hypothetical protein
MRAVFYGVETFDPCETEVVKTLPSPNGDRNLIVFHRDCGATTDFNTQISLLPSGQRFSFDKFPAFFSVGGSYDLKVNWLSNDEIQITVPKAERVYRRDRSPRGAVVVYR